MKRKLIFFKVREQAIGDFLYNTKINSFTELLALVEVILENWDNIGVVDRINKRIFELIFIQIVKEKNINSLQEHYHMFNQIKNWSVLQCYPEYRKLYTLIDTRIAYLNALKEVGLQKYV